MRGYLEIMEFSERSVMAKHDLVESMNELAQRRLLTVMSPSILVILPLVCRMRHLRTSIAFVVGRHVIHM